MAFKQLASQLPPLIADVEAALQSTISSPSNHASLEQRAGERERTRERERVLVSVIFFFDFDFQFLESLFEVGNMKIMAQPGLTDGSPLSVSENSTTPLSRFLMFFNSLLLKLLPVPLVCWFVSICANC
jgi:hypothetical protein